MLVEDHPPNPPEIFVGCANPIDLTSELGFQPEDEIKFKVLEADARGLMSRLGRNERYCIDSGPAFWAALTFLEHCQPTDGTLRLLGKPVLRCVLTVRKVLDATCP